MSKKKKYKKDKKEFATKTLYVSGIHCASCELLIEKKLLMQDGVEAVDVSIKDATVTFTGANVHALNPQTLDDLFADLGYTFHTQKTKMGRSGKMLNYVIAVNIILLSLLFLATLDGSTLARFTGVDQSSSLVAFIVLGLVASVSSCAALVGGLLLSLTKQWNDTYIGESSVTKFKPHMQFHVGRIGAYVLGGALLGTIGDVLSFDNLTFFAVVILFVSIIMLVISIQMIGLPWAQKFRVALPKSMLTVVASHKTKTPFLIGAGTFFLPCGFTLIAQGIALTTGSLIGGALVMSAFVFGTLPILLAISFGGVSLNAKPHLTARFNVIAGALIFVFALYNINGQLNVLGLPSFSDIRVIGQAEQKGQQKAVTFNGEEQVIAFVADEFDYIPTGSTTLKAGVPTKMIVDNKGILGCGAFMAARGLFEGTVNLKRGENIIEFVPERGAYKLTCSMGMVPPVTINVQ